MDIWNENCDLKFLGTRYVMIADALNVIFPSNDKFFTDKHDDFIYFYHFEIALTFLRSIKSF